MVSVVATRPVTALTAYNCDGWKSFSRSQILDFESTVTESASTSSSLIEYILGDFVEAIYKVEHHIYIGTVLEINESDNEVLVSFMEPSVVFKSNPQTFRSPKKADEIWLKKFCALLNSSSTGDKLRLQS